MGAKMMLAGKEWDDLSLHMAGFSLSPEERADLLAPFPRGLLKSKHALAVSFRAALTEQFKAYYYTRRQQKTGVPFGAIPETDATEKNFVDAACWCFERNVSLEKLFACAEETLTSTRFPTSGQLKSDFLRERVIFWIPKSQRKKEGNGFVNVTNTHEAQQEAVDEDILYCEHENDFPGLSSRG